RREAVKTLCVVTQARHGPLTSARQRLERASRALFTRILGYTGEGSSESRHLLAWAISVHETGRAIIELRRDMPHAGEALRARIGHVIDALAALYEAPGRRRYADARRRLVAALREAGEAGNAGVLRHLHLLRLALLDRGSVLARYMRPGAAAPQEEVRHAA